MKSALRSHDVLSQCVNQSQFPLPGCGIARESSSSVNQSIYPPLFPLVGGFVVFLAGSSITALAMTNVPFIAVLVAATYLMGRTMHSRLAGVLAALLIVAYPLIFQMSREFMLEFAMLAIAAAACCFLVLADGFRKPGMTILFGLTTGLGALSKFTLLTYLAGPVAVHGRAPDNRRRAAPRRCARGGAATVDARGRPRTRSRRRGPVVLAEPCGFPGWSAGRGIARYHRLAGAVAGVSAYYPNAMIWTQMGPPLFLLFMYGAWRFASHVTPERRDLLLVWIGSIYVIQTLVSHKGPHNEHRHSSAGRADLRDRHREPATAAELSPLRAFHASSCCNS